MVFRAPGLRTELLLLGGPAVFAGLITQRGEGLSDHWGLELAGQNATSPVTSLPTMAVLIGGPAGQIARSEQTG